MKTFQHVYSGFVDTNERMHNIIGRYLSTESTDDINIIWVKEMFFPEFLFCVLSSGGILPIRWIKTKWRVL